MTLTSEKDFMMSLSVVVEKAWTLCVALGGMESCASCQRCTPLEESGLPALQHTRPRATQGVSITTDNP